MIQPIKIKPVFSNLERIKKIPITSIYNGALKQTGRVLMGKCPFHDDSNPSFAIYPETNTFNCFAGCGFGDVIDFYMKIQDIDLKTALKSLENKL